MTGVDEDLNHFPHQPKTGLVGQFQVGIDPCVRVGLAKSLKSELLFDGRKALDYSGQAVRFFKNVVCDQFPFLRLDTRSSPDGVAQQDCLERERWL